MKLFVCALALVAVVMPQRIGLRLNPESTPPPPTGNLTAANFGSVTTYRMPSSGFDSSTWANVGMHYVYHGNDGKTHILFIQNIDGHHNDTIGQSTIWETQVDAAGSDPASWASATRLTCVQNWGATGTGCLSGSPYDMWNGLYGGSYDTGSLVVTTGLPPLGSSFQNGYFYTAYGSPYGNYVPVWSVIASQCSSPGHCTTYGPWRTCGGVFPYGGNQDCGPRINIGFFPCTVGGVSKYCDAAGGGSANQDEGSIYGFSVYAYDSLPDSATPAGYGSTRGGDSAYRTTDILASSVLMEKYNLTNLFDATTGLTTGGHNVNEATTRPPIHSAPPYLWEAYITSDGPAPGPQNHSYADPSAYAGTGSWVIDGDVQAGATWVNTGSQSGFVTLALLSTQSRYYQTNAIQVNTKQSIVFERTTGYVTGEAAMDMHAYAPQPAGLDSELEFDALLPNQGYTIRMINPGASHGTVDCSFSSGLFTVTLKTDGSGNATATAGEIATAVNASGCNTRINVQPACGSSRCGASTLVPVGFSSPVRLARGPFISPVYGNDCHVLVTGPCTDLRDVQMAYFNNGDLSPTPLYNIQPAGWVSIQGDLNANARFLPTDLTGADTNRYSKLPCGFGYDPVDQSLWVCAFTADTNDGSHLIHRIQLVDVPLRPAPTLIDQLLALVPDFSKMRQHVLALFEAPK